VFGYEQNLKQKGRNMNDSNLSDEELIRAVDNDSNATPRERELANRLQKLLDENYRLETFT